ncbi:MAG TPA: 23S rRNA (pseudouridine(1915)-N(3))-methyltransferase RlmH [Saprospiraceae bacterium]|nr:23S rRNA (pseudouridine(1915)-N(3))-methyltransferase RlmH [Saprospiraceae bacterium]HMP12809.1 23S rRNA (pseudouridine(1915)-N(3))-methyltransferase RlmH [Saprospiraceae bacterium]
MKVALWIIGKTADAYLETGIAVYAQRLKHYLPFSIEVVPDVRQGNKLHPEQLKEREAEAILDRLKKEDVLILLDERGQTFTSEAFAHFLEQRLNSSGKRLIFLIGGAYGVADTLYARANGQVALSAMTFSHQMVRLFFVEQLYRAMTILRNEPYHNN